MSQSINLLLIPYNNVDTISVPKGLVEYVLPYAQPLPSASSHRAVIGSLIYKNAKVPVLDLARLGNADKKMTLPEISDGKYRIVILSCLSQSSFCDNYAVIANNPPYLVNIGEENIEEVQEEISPFFYSKVKLSTEGSEQLAYIPDLEKLEKELFSDNA